MKRAHDGQPFAAVEDTCSWSAQASRCRSLRQSCDSPTLLQLACEAVIVQLQRQCEDLTAHWCDRNGDPLDPTPPTPVEQHLHLLQQGALLEDVDVFATPRPTASIARRACPDATQNSRS